MPDSREPYGRIVHDIRLAAEAGRAAAEGRVRFDLGTWEYRSDHQRELDMRIGAAVAAAERERIRQLAIRHEAFYDAPCPDGVADCTRQDMPFVGLLDSEGASDAT